MRIGEQHCFPIPKLLVERLHASQQRKENIESAKQKFWNRKFKETKKIADFALCISYGMR